MPPALNTEPYATKARGMNAAPTPYLIVGDHRLTRFGRLDRGCLGGGRRR